MTKKLLTITWLKKLIVSEKIEILSKFKLGEKIDIFSSIEDITYIKENL